MMVLRSGVAVFFWIVAVLAIWPLWSVFPIQSSLPPLVLAFALFSIVLSITLSASLFIAMGLMVIIWHRPQARRKVRIFVLVPLIFGVFNGMTGYIMPPFIRRDLSVHSRQEDGVTDGFDLMI